MKKGKYLLLSAVLILSSCVYDDIDESIDEEGLTLRLEQIIEKSDFPGFTIGIVKNGTASYQKSFGFQNIENNVSYTNQTKQPLASISKTFLGAATVKAIELGYFDLETPINDILINDLINPKNPSGKIQVKHLVNHTSGLIDEENTYSSSYYILSGQNNTTAGAQILQDYGASQRTPKTLSELINAYYYDGGEYYSLDNFSDTTPGEEENYSNVTSSLMAYLIEISSGISYQEFVETHIFRPLGMNNTSFKYKPSNNNYATLYFDKNTPFPMYGLESFPDGGLKTSNDDLMKFFLNMIEGQRGETNILFKKSSYQLLFTETSSTYSIFWDVDLGKNAFGHSGGDPGVSTDLHFSGSANAGFFILSNYDALTDSHEDHYDEVQDEINKLINKYLSS